MALLLLFVSCARINQLPAQTAKDSIFEKTLKNVVERLAKRDSVGLSKYIHKKTGLYILCRIGVYDNYYQYATIGFSDSTYPKMPFYDGVRVTKLKHEKLPSFDCGKQKWSKTGTFVDTNRIDRLLSKTAKRLNLYKTKTTPPAKLQRMLELESKSRRIVIAQKEYELVLYLSYIDDKWFLTIIDKATSDCSV